MLHDVREQFGDDEVDRAGDLGTHRRVDGGIDLHADRQRASRRDGAQRRREAAVLQERRRDSCRERAQLVERRLRVDLGFAGELGRSIRVSCFRSPLEGGEVQLQAHQSLLGSVVDVALEPSQRGVLGLHRRAAGGGFGPHLGGEVVGRPAAQHAARDRVVQPRESAHRPRQRDREDDPGEQVEHDLDRLSSTIRRTATASRLAT